MRHFLSALAAIVLLLTTLSSRGQTPYFFFNLAGKPGTSGTTNLPGPDARFNAPSGITIDSLGNVIVADTANHTIRAVTGDATVSAYAGVPGTNGSSNGPVASALFSFPMGVASDNTSGAIYVADWGNHLIRKILNGQVTTAAGLAGKPGWADGGNTIAQLNHPASVAVDSLGQVFIADEGNDAIRVITTDGSLATLVGSPGIPGSADGTNAQFNHPCGITIGNAALFVADTGNDTIREITVVGGVWTVKTLAGSPGLVGTNDLVGAAARFSSPTSVSADTGGANIYVTDFGNDTLRVVSLSGLTTTLAGSPTTSGAAGGTEAMTLLNWPAGVVVDGANNVFMAERGNNVIMEGIPVTGPQIVVQPQSQTSVPDGSATFSVTAIGLEPLTYQWKLNGNTINSPSNSTVEIDDLDAGGGGTITVEVVSPYGDVVSSNADLVVAEPNSFITWAGKAATAGYADGAGGDALFNNPGGITTDTNGNIYVADTFNDVIREIIPNGLIDCKVKTLAGNPNDYSFADGVGSNAMFRSPYGICIDSNGTVIVGDSFNYVLRKVQQTGSNWTVTTFAGLPDKYGTNDGVGTYGEFGRPVSLAVGLGGNYYVADYWNCELRQVTPDGDITTLKGPGLFDAGPTNLPFSWLYGISSTAGLKSDGEGNLYVADDGNNQIFKVSTDDGGATWAAANYAGMQTAYGDSVDGLQNIARFNDPQGVALDGKGNVFVADSGNSTIRKILPDQSVVTIAGVAGMTNSADGVGDKAQFNGPLDMVFDPNGALFVADSGNNTIRKQLPDPLIAQDPQAQTVQLNSNTTFNVLAASTTSLTYQWLKNGSAMANQDEDSLTIHGAQPSDVANYSVVVSTPTMSITSAVAKLILQTPPIIKAGPISQTVTNGAPVTFTATVIGTGPLTYQWMLNLAPLPGQTKTNLVIPIASTNDLGAYALAVNGPVANIISSNAILSFVPPKTGIITWGDIAGMTYGQPLTTNQLNATAKVPGSFAYSPTNGSVLDAGTNVLTVVFTPNDIVDYSVATDTVSVVVAPAPLAVTVANASRQIGQTNPTFTGTISGLVNGDKITLKYECAASNSSPAGLYPIIPILQDPNDRSPNYAITATDGTLTVIGGLLRAAQKNGGAFSFSWPMVTGETYQLQTTLDLSKPWIDVGDPIVGTNALETLTIPIVNKLEYFRVIPTP
ncbi:MAG TPA: MBG domain-containing protein [Verrucomicrobiae bacterium]